MTVKKGQGVHALLRGMRLRTWDHFTVVKIERKDFRTKGVTSWAGWIRRSEVEKSKFPKLVLCPCGDRTEIREDEHDGLVAALQERLEVAAAAVKATTTAVLNRNKFTVADEIMEMGAEAAQCRDPVKRKLSRQSPCSRQRI